MKTFLSYLLFFFAATSYGQNWSLFNSNDRYNYKLKDSTLITNVLMADSFKVVGADTIYSLNRIVDRLNKYITYDTVYKNQPQFMRKNIKRSLNGMYVFFDPDTIVINAFANQGDFWLYDTTANIVASVVFADTFTQFGMTDSMKVIVLSSGDTIITSKIFGIVRFPADTSYLANTYYSLAGIENRVIGDSVINFRNIYDFNVGDIFMDSISEYQPGNWFYTQWKYTILNKIVFADSVQYTVRNVKSTFQWPSVGPPVIVVDTTFLTFQDSILHPANAFPGEFTNCLEFGFGQSSAVTFSRYLTDPVFNLPCKQLGIPWATGIYTAINGNQLSYTYNGLISSNDYCTICAGVGDTHYKLYGFEYEYHSDLIGYIKNGAQFGTVYSDGEITGIPVTFGEGAAINVYPQVVNDLLFINTNYWIKDSKCIFSVYDLTGRLILSDNLYSSHSAISCNHLSSAIYLWWITDKDNVMLDSGKIIKQ